MPKRVLILSLTYYPTFVGGAEVALKELTNRLGSDELEFHLVTARFDTALPKDEHIRNVFVHRVGFGLRGATIADTHRPFFYLAKVLFVPAAALAMLRLHARLKFDALWAMMSYMLFPIVLARIVGARVPYVLTLQEGDPFEHVFTRWYILPFRPLLAWGFRHAAVVQCISTFLADWARAMGGACPVVVIPNAVDTECFGRPVPSATRSTVRQRIGKQEGDVWLIHTGRYVRKNSLDTVVRALVHLPEHVHAFFIGEGPDSEQYLAIAREAGVVHRLHLHPYVPLSDIPTYLQACDIFVRPSRSEGMGNSFIEAMAAGLPVVATQEGGIADFLFDAKRNPDKEPTGWAVDKDAPEQVADAVRDILEHPQEVLRVVENARRMVREKYDWDHIAERLQREVFDVVAAA